MCGLGDLGGADVATGAAAIFDHEGLLERKGQLLGHYPRGDVGGAASGERHHDAHRLDRPLLRRCERRHKHDGCREEARDPD